MCPGQNNQYNNLMIFNNGSVNRNLEYEDVCELKEVYSEPVYHKVNYAYNNYPNLFGVDPWQDEFYGMQEMPLRMKDIVPTKENAFISRDNEILKIFFKHNNIIPNWIYCNWNWGSFNPETGQWSGAIGKVKFFD